MFVTYSSCLSLVHVLEVTIQHIKYIVGHSTAVICNAVQVIVKPLEMAVEYSRHTSVMTVQTWLQVYLWNDVYKDIFYN